jgi:hypothetical protein
MCVNCLTQTDAIAANALVTAALLKGPTHRVLADLGVVAPPDPVARDVRTVAFLRTLDLDPEAVLGAEAVAGADARVAAEAAGRRAPRRQPVPVALASAVAPAPVPVVVPVPRV